METFILVKPEHKFHPKRRWRIDYYLPTLRIGIEIEGGVWTGGRHTHPAGFTKDMEKYNTAALMGIAIYRLTATDARSPLKARAHVARIKNFLTHPQSPV